VAARRDEGGAGAGGLIRDPRFRRVVALNVAAVAGFVTLAALDAWWPSTKLLDRFSAYITGFGIARGLGLLAGAPLVAPPNQRSTWRGLLAALCTAMPGLVWVGAVVSALLQPAATWAPDATPPWTPSAWIDLECALAVAIVAPLSLLALRAEPLPTA
jgi:hypothetical protein